MGESGAAVDPSGVCPAEGNQVVGDLAGKWVKPMEGGAINSSGYGSRPAPPGTAGGECWPTSTTGSTSFTLAGR